MCLQKPISGRKNDEGVVITLVAVFMLFVVGAMAALSIDVVTFYTARSEAQLAADSGALAAARVLANSGMTSDSTAIGDGVASSAETLATTVAMQVASSNYVGGRTLVPGGICPATEICISFPNDTAASYVTNPHVTVQVQRTDLPTFFGRIWGSKQVTVAAQATAEAYNPSGATIPVAPMCVKPWLLPNLDPSKVSPVQIFDTTTGAIEPTATQVLGYTSTPANPLKLACGAPGTAHPPNCSASSVPVPQAWQYYPGDPVDFPAPTAFPACTPALITSYEKSVAGCIQTPISCNSQVNVETTPYPTRRAETAEAVNCLTHAAGNGGDKVDVTPPGPPFQFIAGDDNPVPGLAGNNMIVSDSLVTLPVIDTGGDVLPANPVQIVGFVQLFLSPTGTSTPANGRMRTTVINLAGCGTSASGQPILGNGASPVAVRLITP